MIKDEDKILYLPWAEQKRLQNEKLHRFVTRHLYPFSPYYRKLFDDNRINPDDIRTAEDLGRIPFTSKQDFRDAIQKDPAKGTLAFCLQPDKDTIKKFLPKTELAKFMLRRALKGEAAFKAALEKEYKPIFLTSTAGTTSTPMPFLYSDYDIQNLKVYGGRMIATIGIQNERLVNLFPYAPHLAFWLAVLGGLSANVFVLSTGGGKTMGTEGNIRTILKMKPQFLLGVPSYVYHVLKTARAENQDFSFLNRIILGASPVPNGFKNKIASILKEMGATDVKVFGTYGFTEARGAWAECPTEISVSSGYHTSPDMEVFEIIDPVTGEVKGEGEDGELVYTGIDARGTCVLRYRTGDLVKGGISYAPCPHCGKTVPRISSHLTRASNIKNVQLSKIKGSLVNLNDLERFLDDRHEINEWQIEIKKKNDDPFEVDELILNVCLAENVNKDTFSHLLNEEVISNAEVSFNAIHYVTHQEISEKIEVESAVKAKKIVDKRPSN
ncbi:MAG: AMP-binding protein [Elusimicrobiales bacterium]|nr:AMP-binding protein [Elusimicrobiales bacterium]